jgi:hypothetical protein
MDAKLAHAGLAGQAGEPNDLNSWPVYVIASGSIYIRIEFPIAAAKNLGF